MEVLDHYRDHGLTMGERDDLLVLAENANDTTRETYGPVHEPYIRRRAGNKSERAWKNSIRALMAKKVLEPVVRGAPRRHAVYRIPDLCPDPPHDGHLGYCTRPDPGEEQVTPQVTHPGSPKDMGHPTGDPTQSDDPQRVTPGMPMGHLTGANGTPVGCEWVTPQVTPPPLPPRNPSLSSATPLDLVRAAAVVPHGEERELIQWIEEHNKIKGMGWWLTVCGNGTIHKHATDWQAARTATPKRPDLPPHCGHCGDLDAGADNPAIRNPKFRYRRDEQGQWDMCTCHPDHSRAATSAPSSHATPDNPPAEPTGPAPNIDEIRARIQRARAAREKKKQPRKGRPAPPAPDPNTTPSPDEETHRQTMLAALAQWATDNGHNDTPDSQEGPTP